MGIEKLAGRLPRKRVDYLKVRRTKGAAMVVRIDAAGALWLCAYRSKETYAFGDFFAAWARWQRLLQQWKMVDFKGELVFDGKDSPHKKPEREHRDAKQQAGHNGADSIAWIWTCTPHHFSRHASFLSSWGV